MKANQGAAGVDGQSIAEFEANLSGNLYKLWNRLSSGSYFPPPVRRVEIPKANGSMRPLGIPTVADRVAQEVVRRYLEPILEPVFHADSYGYRPGKSALDAVHQARQRCWRVRTLRGCATSPHNPFTRFPCVDPRAGEGSKKTFCFFVTPMRWRRAPKNEHI